MGVQPYIRIFEGSLFMERKLPAIAKKPRLSNDARQPSVMFAAGPDNKRMNILRASA